MKRSFDIWLILPLAGLSLFGIFNMFGIKKELLTNQLFFFVLGFIILLFFSKIGIKFFQLNERPIYVLFLILFLVTFIFGESIRGSRRWIDLYFFQFQTSEFFKPFFLITLSRFLAHRHLNHDEKRWLMVFLLFFVPFIIIFKQPDLGSAIIYGLVFVGIIFLTGFPMRRFLYLFIAWFFLLPFFWRLLKIYQKQRIESFFNPGLDSQGIAYNLIQSIITVGSGGLLGRGLGLGTQSRFRFLPEHHTDFAFASLVEQFGLIGGAAVVILYGVVIYRVLARAVKNRSDTFSFLFLMGTAIFLTVSVSVNVGMNMGLLPVAGIALPLISYGGSSTISTFILLGLALSI